MQSQRQLVVIVQSAKRRVDRQSEPASFASRPVGHLFEIDCGAKNVRSSPLPWRAYVRFSQPDPEISTEEIWELAKK